ncbi:MAG: squalene synthase HpnC [Rhodospirillales bacterium]|nr:squalene synthase HpnC [Rhodospirillales bacterium]
MTAAPLIPAADISSVETPSGKDAAYENFPVGSWLLPARLRPHVATFYAFARTIDDIADNPGLSAEDKVARLDVFEDVVLGQAADIPGYEKAAHMRDSLLQTGVEARHCIDLLAAFKLDAVKSRYRDWADLMGYCELSAAPVGRYLLDLHGGSRDGYGPSDALCMGLQVINHVQDCQDDYRQLNRVYLPQDWMDEAGVRVEDLDDPQTSPGMRRVLDRCLEATEVLLADAEPLPGGLRSRRLAMESAVILGLAKRLVFLLRRHDPLASRVELSRADFIRCGIRGVLAGLF